MKRRTVAVLSLFLLLACTRAPDAPGTNGEGATDSALAQDESVERGGLGDDSGTNEPGVGLAEEDEVPEPEQLFGEAEVRMLLSSWLDAQNAGDFERYSSLYNERFFGVERSGPRTVRFDREGWLDDRGRMFEGLSVEASDVSIVTTGRTAVIRFTQRWATARYEDVSPKQLVVTWNGDGIGISREEMFESTIVSDQRASASVDTTGVRPVISVGDSMYLVVDETIPDSAVLSGRARSDLRGFAASHALDRDGSGAEPNRGNIFAEGATVRLFGPDGSLCTATLGVRRVMARMEPHFGAVDAWNGEMGVERASDATVAAEVFEMGHRVLVAELDTSDACAGALWAHPAGRPGAMPLELLSLTPDLGTFVRGHFRRTPEFSELQGVFISEYGGTIPWFAYDGAQLHVRAFGANGNLRVIVVSGNAGAGCGEFSGALSAVFTVSGDGGHWVVAESPIMIEGAFAVDAVLQFSGATYLLAEEAFWELGVDDLQCWLSFEVPSFDCPC